MAKSRKRRTKNQGGTATGRTAPVTSHAPRITGQRARTAATSGHLDKLLVILCAAGVVLTAYLTYVAVAGDHPMYCSDGAACDLVQSSRWANLLGVPMAGWGLFTYLALTLFCWLKSKKPSRWKHAFLIAFCGLGISTYLTAISVFQIEATCGYCLASYALMATITVRLAQTKPTPPATGEWRQVVGLPFVSAAVLVATLQLHYSGLFDPAAGPEQPRIRGLVLHLNDIGARFYGANWCLRCQEQKALFGASVDRLPYIECSPQGRGGPQSATCAIRTIREYPTWIINGQRHAGLQSLPSLEKLSGFKPKP